MTYQFLHGETYGRTGAHRKNSRARKSGIDAIRAELMREPQACSHVASPLPPTIVFGDHPDNVITAIKAKAEQAVDKAGHRLRCDAPVLFAGVASWPVPQAVIENDQWLVMGLQTENRPKETAPARGSDWSRFGMCQRGCIWHAYLRKQDANRSG